MQPNMIGVYGDWAASLVGDAPARMSFRTGKWSKVDEWRSAARGRFFDLIAQPLPFPPPLTRESGEGVGIPKVTVHRQYTYDGLHIEELSWQLPYGNRTEAVFLKPEGARGKLPGIVGLHDHGGNKYFGYRKITKTGEHQHPLMTPHQQGYYGGAAWANEIAKRGYAVLVHDTFTFGSRRVLMKEVADSIRNGLTDDDPENPQNIAVYNNWAGNHEHIMAKSLFSAGTTWPGVFLAEDRRAVDVLCAREDVDATRLGCAGLSGGGLRTVMLGGADDRIGCAVCVGMMSTWRDYLLNKCYTHTWMCYVPLLPLDLDYPEILGLRVPLPTLVLNNINDQLFTMPEMERADAMLHEVYDHASAGDRYRCSFYPGPHKFDLDMQKEAFEWFDQWLKKA